MKLNEYTKQWQETILPLKTPATQVTFSSHIRKLNSYLGGVELSELTEAKIQAHVSELAKVLTPRGVKNYWGTCRLIFNRAGREGLVKPFSPDLPKIFKKQQPWLTAEQMRRIVEESEGQYKVLFYLLAETGMRIGEALGLQWGDINGESIAIQRSLFNGKTQPPKTSSAIRTLSISGTLATLLRSRMGASPSSFVFSSTANGPLASNVLLTRHLHPALRSAGQTSGGFHSFRRGNASIMANIGVPEKIAAQRLGHGLPGLTFGLYAQTIEGADRPWVEKIAEQIR